MVKQKVYVTSCDISKDAFRHQEFKLKDLYKESDRKYELIDNPIDADIIILGNVDDKTGEKLIKNPLINTYPDKCFSLSYIEHALILNRGVYTSTNNRSLISWRRVRTASYMLYPEIFKNPFITSYNYDPNNSNNKKYLFSFIGRICNLIRIKIFDLKFVRDDILIEDSTQFNLWGSNTGKLERQDYFHQILEQSKFSLCPRGIVPNSIRLFESLQMGIAPVIISDAFLFPRGPDWKKFSIIIKEKHISDLEAIVTSYENDYEAMGKQARSNFEYFFSDSTYFNYVVDNCFDLIDHQIIPEAVFWKMRYIYLYYLTIKAKLKKR